MCHQGFFFPCHYYFAWGQSVIIIAMCLGHSSCDCTEDRRMCIRDSVQEEKYTFQVACFQNSFVKAEATIRHHCMIIKSIRHRSAEIMFFVFCFFSSIDFPE